MVPVFKITNMKLACFAGGVIGFSITSLSHTLLTPLVANRNGSNLAAKFLIAPIDNLSRDIPVRSVSIRITNLLIVRFSYIRDSLEVSSNGLV